MAGGKGHLDVGPGVGQRVARAGTYHRWVPGRPAPFAARAAAAVALVAVVVLVVGGLVFVGRHPVAVVGAVVAFVVAVATAWIVVTRQRFPVPLAIADAIVAVVGVILLVVAGHDLAYVIAMVGAAVIAAGGGAVAFRWEIAAAVARRWAPAPPARRGVLLMNPKSGGGVVERLDLASEAKRRGIDAVLLGHDDDLRTLALAAVERGADVLGMAGGDGSQAVVASVAAEHGLGFVCVPAGTRNHLALDLGVDRADVIGSLEAFGPARQTRIDLATVNEQVFVNNVSLGVYAKIVASPSYRDAKLKTAASMLPELLGPHAQRSDLHLDVPDAAAVDDPQIVIVSNNPYRLDRLAGLGTRAHLNCGVLGVAALRLESRSDAARFVAAEAAGRVDRFPGWQSWQPASVVISSARSVAAGVDGESLTIPPPLKFETRPGALAARLAPHHSGLSPAARDPGLGRATFLGLWRVCVGRPSGLVS